MKPYFYVYRYGDKAPTVRHETLDEAQAEAERLAATHPGVQFEILQCLGFASTSKVSTFWNDGAYPLADAETETEPEYYYLKEGDMRMKGDEWKNQTGEWRESCMAGFPLPSHRVGFYRRKIK